ncbi:MAG: ABC transporter ATP-binding protein [Chloroflexi bacterium RBG_19FT_COMBO_50_10]|nr:MAG: ABC transporter ATP-binding protein [Chloroflexi bacterium RBG_19FT_COMBO_50_10]
MNIKLGGSLEGVKVKVIEALKAQGFGILTEIDVQKTLKQKIGVDFKPYLILGACNPHFAYRALSADEAIGLLLPCNVVLMQEVDGVAVSIQDPEVMFSVVDDDTKNSMVGLPQEVKHSLQSVVEALSKVD